MAPRDPAAPDPLLDPPAWAPDWLPTVDDVRRVGYLRLAVLGVLFLGLGACVLRGADSPADPEVLGADQTPSSTIDLSGDLASPPGVSAQVVELASTVGLTQVELVDAVGEVLVGCYLDAEIAPERSQGLMGVTDLSGVDGMLFTGDGESAGAFFMFRTLIPLTVGWWNAAGAYIGQTDMVPCESESGDDCPRYPAPAPYLYAIEVPLGDPLARRFVGSTLRDTEQGCSLR